MAIKAAKPKEISNYITPDKKKMFTFFIEGEKIIVKRYNLTLEEEKTFE